ncbi:hypothetical protein GCM10010499_46910 [Streptomyces thermoviolaceus subsp. apingens]|jgi:hypothetical protein|nr:hypothetical protein GCM10010499_46910 [Streptomyces thermoviolaceus subsp. apingens]
MTMYKIEDMRRNGILVSSIGVTSLFCLALTSALPATAVPAAPEAAAAAAHGAAARGTARSAVPGTTQSLPLVPLDDTRLRGRGAGAVRELGLRRTRVRPFSLLGVVWDDPRAQLHGSAQVRTRSAATGAWSDWQDLETHHAGHGPDPSGAARADGPVHGGTAPLWVGDSDAVEVRVRAASAPARGAAKPGRDTGLPLPAGLRLELVDPGAPVLTAGAAPADDGASASDPAEAANAALAPPGTTVIPPADREQTERELSALRATDPQLDRSAEPRIGPRPGIVTRRGWGADESLRESGFGYTKRIEAVFVHHTATGNAYTCAQAPSVVRSIYRYHAKSMGWRDIGYNFLIDPCGTIYEGRAGGVARPVLGAHTLGFNSDTVGVAVIGTYTTARPSSAAVDAVARLAAWKLGLYGADPRGHTYLTSGGGNLHQKGKKVRLHVISGHRDGFATECPGGRLYGELGTIRTAAARHQGR